MQIAPQGKNQNTDRLRQEILERIRSLQARANRGIWLVAAFLVVSIAASRGFDLFPELSFGARSWLGAAPPVRMIQLALVVYAFSASVLILARMAKGDPPGKNFTHVLYLTAFYGFFHYAQALGDNFWAVLVAGGTVLGLAAFQNWTYCSTQIRQEEEFLQDLDRRRNLTGF
jgi:hypothetical protein